MKHLLLSVALGWMVPTLVRGQAPDPPCPDCAPERAVELANPRAPVPSRLDSAPVEVAQVQTTDARRAALQVQRSQLRLGLFAALGYTGFRGTQFASETTDPLSIDAPRFGLGLDVRKNFAHWAGVRIRVGFDAAVSRPDRSFFGEPITYRALALRVFVAPAIRFGRTHRRAPFYADVGGHLDAILYRVEPTGELGPRTKEVRFSIGPEIGVGVVFGEERFDLGIRSNLGFQGRRQFQFWGTDLVFSVSFL